MYTIDGVPLSDPKGRWSVHRASQRRTPVAFRSVDVDVPGVDGNIPIYGEQVEATALALGAQRVRHAGPDRGAGELPPLAPWPHVRAARSGKARGTGR